MCYDELLGLFKYVFSKKLKSLAPLPVIFLQIMNISCPLKPLLS